MKSSPEQKLAVHGTWRKLGWSLSSTPSSFWFFFHFPSDLRQVGASRCSLAPGAWKVPGGSRAGTEQGQSSLGWLGCHSLTWGSSVGTGTSRGSQGQKLSQCPFPVQIQPMKDSWFFCLLLFWAGGARKVSRGLLAFGSQVFIAVLPFDPSYWLFYHWEQNSPSVGLLTCDRGCELGLDLCETGDFTYWWCIAAISVLLSAGGAAAPTPVLHSWESALGPEASGIFHRLLTEVVDTPSLLKFKIRSDGIVSNLI